MRGCVDDAESHARPLEVGLSPRVGACTLLFVADSVVLGSGGKFVFRLGRLFRWFFRESSRRVIGFPSRNFSSTRPTWCFDTRGAQVSTHGGECFRGTSLRNIRIKKLFDHFKYSDACESVHVYKGTKACLMWPRYTGTADGHLTRGSLLLEARLSTYR